MDALFNRRPPSLWDRFSENPLVLLARIAYNCTTRGLVAPTVTGTPIRVVCVSDTHNRHDELPPVPAGDILIHSGDLTVSGTPQELRSVLQWLSDHPHPYKIFIAGNHDKALDATPEALSTLLTDFPSLIFLNESSTTLTIHDRTLRIYGSPLTPTHGSWPFQYPRTTPNAGNWTQIPVDTDILITHGPAALHGDGLWRRGCTALLDALWKIRPRLHVFGHIHDARGIENVAWSDTQRQYETICMGDGGWLALFSLVWKVVWGWRERGIAQTTMVNAACVGGGIRDDERRSAIVVDI
ncbi:Metallo-dependent phosphatase [Pholiota conissans]|uniref:Metallo-dependent phosphatase n=1 Tax=Pholiota conissans TaxID=109636 RepID=A0A9P5YX67_9AGAR|nr:Metallo-dependent phosphatase [Pholiota conissans]